MIRFYICLVILNYVAGVLSVAGNSPALAIMNFTFAIINGITLGLRANE